MYFEKSPDDQVKFAKEINWMPCPFILHKNQAVVDITDKVSIPAQYRFKINSFADHPVSQVRVAYDGVFVLNEMVTNEGKGVYNFTHTAATSKEHKITVQIDFEKDAKGAGFGFLIEEINE